MAQALIDHGKAALGWLGVSIGDPAPDQPKALKLKTNKGAMVTDGVTGSPAETAGLKEDDRVVTFQGRAVADAADLQRRVGDTPVGNTVDLTVDRNGKSIDLAVTIGNQETGVRRIAASLEDRLGVVVRPLQAEESSQYGLEPGRGVAIATLDRNGVLEHAGFEKDDVVLDVNNLPVEGFVALIKALPPHQPALLKAVDHRTGQSGFVEMTFG